MGLSGKHKRVDWQVSLPLANVTLRRWGRRAAALLGAYAWARWYTANFSVSLQQALLDTLRASKQRALERDRTVLCARASRLRNAPRDWRPSSADTRAGSTLPSPALVALCETLELVRPLWALTRIFGDTYALYLMRFLCQALVEGFKPRAHEQATTPGGSLGVGRLGPRGAARTWNVS